MRNEKRCASSLDTENVAKCIRQAAQRVGTSHFSEPALATKKQLIYC